ncbi:MAG: hypothetical protein ACR2PM_16750 [Hyphomicrobiales bacterium]
MFRWLEGNGGSDREKVLEGFRRRFERLEGATDDERRKVGVALALIWRDLLTETGSLNGYAEATRKRQKDLLVRLVKYEITCREAGNQAESLAAELLSYLLAMIAAGDDEGERIMSAPIQDLARLGDPDIAIARDAA